jgi:2-iminobutanoate/2-iminopropanoate deaminase
MLRHISIASVLCLLAWAAPAADAGHKFFPPETANPATAPPYSSGVSAGGVFYLAGHVAADPSTGQVPADVEREVHVVMDQVQATLKRAGLGMDELVSVTVYCTDLSLYDKFNAIYRGYFTGAYPARAFIGVDKLVRGARFEVSGVAVKR